MAPYAQVGKDLLILEHNAVFAQDIMLEKLALGSNILHLFEKDDRKQVRRAFDKCLDKVMVKGKRILVASGEIPVYVLYDVELSWLGGSFGVRFFLEGDKLRNEVDELHDFFNKAPIALHWLSDDGKVLWANDRELEVLGYSREEYIGEEIMKFCPDSEENVLQIFKQLGSGNTIRDVPVRFRTKTGVIKDLLIDSNVNYTHNGNFNHTRCFIRDDTGRKVREARVEESRVAAEKVSKEKECFTSKIIHEIKTPIHIMNMIMETDKDPDLKDLRDQVNILSRLVNNVSTAMEFDEGFVAPYEPETVDAREFFGKFTEKAVHVTVTMKGSTKILIDAEKVSTAVSEIANYCKGVASDGQVHMRVRGSSKCVDGYTVEIWCTGGRCDEATIQQHFHRYWLDIGSSDLKSDLPGLNLGLNIAFNNVQHINSDLTVDVQGDRTVFSFDLNHHGATCPETQEDGREVIVVPDGLGLNDSVSKHILLVEDNTISQKMCKRLLEKIGHTCVVADNGKVAVDTVSGQQCVIYDLILMDIRMPVMDGLEATRRIKEYLRRLKTDIPIVALTAEENVDLTKEEFNVGFSHVLKKPSSLGDIEEAVIRFA